MNRAASFVAHNDLMIAVGTIGSIVSLVWLLFPPARRGFLYIRTAVLVSRRAAQRRRNLYRTFEAVRCMNSPSYFLAQCVLTVVAHIGAASFIALNAFQQGIDMWTMQNAGHEPPFFMSLTLAIMMTLVVIVLIRMFFELGDLSTRVRKLIRRSERRDAGSRRRRRGMTS